MTLTITNGRNTFQYRQREAEPNILESRATYRGARWSFIARFDTADDARAALLAIEAKWRQAAGDEEQEGKQP